MKSLTQNKTLLGVIILAAFLILGFLFYSWSSPSLGTANTNSDSGQMGQALLITLAGLNTIRLNGEIFTDPVFISLTDFGVVIPSQPTGRRNPFLPIGAAN
ncbi:hypothetical protein K2Q00_02295 [Patescibacteria group bacterium]|nr:hypothetical protein [Patescibacteria group bacterium]